MKEGTVLSDLHLFARRSLGLDHYDRIRREVHDRDFLVLNGDIFDFRWSRDHDSYDHAFASAAEWLEQLADVNERCRVVYVMGNHDGYRGFAPYLEDLAERRANFRWNPSHVRIGSCLFLHGDLVLPARGDDPFRRRLHDGHRRRGRVGDATYAVVLASRVLRLTRLWTSPRRCAARILRRLREDRSDLADGLTDVYFGHTHEPFRNFAVGALTFHNTGSSVRHMPFHPLAVQTA